MLDKIKPVCNPLWVAQECKYKQASLVRGTTQTIVWLPEALAKKHLNLIHESGTCWSVLESYGIRIDKEELHQDWRVGGLL